MIQINKFVIIVNLQDIKNTFTIALTKLIIAKKNNLLQKDKFLKDFLIYKMNLKNNVIKNFVFNVLKIVSIIN